MKIKWENVNGYRVCSNAERTIERIDYIENDKEEIVPYHKIVYKKITNTIALVEHWDMTANGVFVPSEYSMYREVVGEIFVGETVEVSSVDKAFNRLVNYDHFTEVKVDDNIEGQMTIDEYLKENN